MIDILYVAKGRPEFTAASLRALLRNTDWRTARLTIYTDGDPDTHVRSIVSERTWPLRSVNWINTTPLGGPINIMLNFLNAERTLRPSRSNVFAKIDNDCIVPLAWLESALDVMQSNPELDLLGLEPALSRTRSPYRQTPLDPSPESVHTQKHGYSPAYAPCDSIGGIGLMRKKAFARYPDMVQHNLYGGFSDWQLRHPDLVKGWIIPPLRLFLLDRLDFSPWKELSARYIANGEQRVWTAYPQSSHGLWDWWLDDAKDVIQGRSFPVKEAG